MSQVKIKENESLDNALRRFKRQTAKDGVIQEVRKALCTAQEKIRGRPQA